MSIALQSTTLLRGSNAVLEHRGGLERWVPLPWRLPLMHPWGVAFGFTLALCLIAGIRYQRFLMGGLLLGIGGATYGVAAALIVRGRLGLVGRAARTAAAEWIWRRHGGAPASVELAGREDVVAFRGRAGIASSRRGRLTVVQAIASVPAAYLWKTWYFVQAENLEPFKLSNDEGGEVWVDPTFAYVVVPWKGLHEVEAEVLQHVLLAIRALVPDLAPGRILARCLSLEDGHSVRIVGHKERRVSPDAAVPGSRTAEASWIVGSGSKPVLIYLDGAASPT